MSALHQMGHDTRNLIAEVAGFAGAIISPVNDGPSEVRSYVDAHKGDSFSFLFDPHLYFPRSDRGQLRTWDYYPADFDTADMTSKEWWLGLGEGMLEAAADLGASEACSPASVPAAYNNEFYTLTLEVAGELKNAANGLRLLQTILVRLEELAIPGRALEIASVVSGTACDGAYIVFNSQTSPRVEYASVEELKGAMALIASLSQSGLEVTVPFTGSEIILWKAAGAHRCATGKFFNLRRFTPGRWEDPNKGGGQVPYWFEEALLASLRQSDVLRVKKNSLLSQASLQNPYGQQILQQLETDPGKSWLALGWRQYMAWFADFEGRAATLDIPQLLEDVESRWEHLKDSKILMEETRNDGRWVRPWRIALNEYLED